MKYPNGCGLSNGEIPNNHDEVKKMSIEYMKTTMETKAGTFRMRRVRGHIMVSLTPKIGGEDVVGKTYTVGRMEKSGFGRGNEWYSSNVRWHMFSNEDGAWQREAKLQTFNADSTPSALKMFVEIHGAFFTRTLLEYEGKVFNPITNETRVHFADAYNDPLWETWIRISDDEQALTRVWSAEFKKLAGAIVPVQQWYNRADHTMRPQRSIWATISSEHTAELGMETGVKLPPHLWTIIDPDTEKDIPIIDPADEDVAIEKEYRELVERNEAIDRMNAAHEARSADPVPQRFQMFKTYTNWPHANTTCKVIAVSDEEVRVEVENSNGNIVRRWATVEWRSHLNTFCIAVNVEPFNIHCYNACDIVEVGA